VRVSREDHESHIAPVLLLMTERAVRLVECAYDLLDEAGLEGLTIRAVLERSGLARRAFYDRFVGKDDLVLAVFTRALRHAADHFGSQMADLPDAMARLHFIVTGIVLGRGSLDEDGWHSNRRGAALSREHLRLAQTRPADLQAAIRPLITLIAEQISQGIIEGRVRAGDAQRMATLVYNLVATTTHDTLLAEEGIAPDRTMRFALAEEIWDFCQHALSPRL
jgi:AcrR family transcriptional regulator